MTGWRHLITATVRLAHRDGTRLRRRPADGRLLFEPVGETTGRSAERVRGIVTGAWALSAEICQGCGGPGDPVTLGRGGRGTRCRDCRKPGDQVLPRAAWRRKREAGNEAPGLGERRRGTACRLAGRPSSSPGRATPRRTRHARSTRIPADGAGRRFGAPVPEQVPPRVEDNGLGQRLCWSHERVLMRMRNRGQRRTTLGGGRTRPDGRGLEELAGAVSGQAPRLAGERTQNPVRRSAVDTRRGQHAVDGLEEATARFSARGFGWTSRRRSWSGRREPRSPATIRPNGVVMPRGTRSLSQRTVTGTPTTDGKSTTSARSPKEELTRSTTFALFTGGSTRAGSRLTRRRAVNNDQRVDRIRVRVDWHCISLERTFVR